MPYTTDGQSLVALPGGGSVSVEVAAAFGTPGYSQNPDGSYTVPNNANFKVLYGAPVPVAQYGYASWSSPAAASAAAPAEFNSGLAATIKNLLSQYGLDELVPNVDQWVRQGLSWAEIEVQLRDPSTAPGKVFDRIFPEVQLRRKAGLAPMSVDQIQDYRTQYRQILRAAGAPEGFYDSNDDARQDLVDDVSLIEVRDRADEWASFGAQLMADPEDAAELEAFERYYSVKVTPFAVAALALDQKIALPALRRMTQSVRLDVAAGRAGFGDLSREEAERLSDVGVTADEAGQAFGTLADSRELFGVLPGEEAVAEDITRAEQFSAAFEGDSRARKRIDNAARRRAAAFGGGGAFASSESGFAGIGSAN